MDLPSSVWTYIADRVTADLAAGTLPELVAAEIHRSWLIDPIRTVIREERRFAERLVSALDSRWSQLSSSCKVLLSSLVHSIYGHDETWRRKVVDFAVAQIDQEADKAPPVGLVFAAFHAGGNRHEDRLLSLVDWVDKNRATFDEVCRGFYAKTKEESVATLQSRMDNPTFRNALPLYLFNLRDAIQDAQAFRSVLERYRHADRPTVRAAVAKLSA